MASSFRQPTPPPLVPFKHRPAPVAAKNNLPIIVSSRLESPQLESTDCLRRSQESIRRRSEATTQIVTCPEPANRNDGDRATSLQVAVQTHKSVTERLRVLVCDDDMIRCGAFQQGLHGALVVVSGSALTSGHLIVLERWDVIFLDLCDGTDGTALQVVRRAVDTINQVSNTLFVVHSLDPCGLLAARMLREAGLRVVVRTFAWLEVALLRRLVRERRWPRQERLTADGFNPPLVLQLPQ